MADWYSFEVHGDPLGSVRQLLGQIWQQADLTGMLVTMDAGGDLKAVPRYITDPAFIDEINPFRPLMEMNIARLIPGTLENHPGQRIAAVLRPCEMRAFIEMTKHAAFEYSDLLTISFDCLGTLPADEYQWRLERLGKSHLNTPIEDTDDTLSDETLQFARQGGLVAYRYRSACQVCQSPEAANADICIHILGLPVRQQILISAANPAISQEFAFEKIASQPIDEHLLAGHIHLVSKIAERHARTMERINQGLGDQLPGNIDDLISQLEICGDCQTCLDVCPICSVDRPNRDEDGHYARPAVMRWLVSCAGCGMCEQACPQSLPISSIFAHIRQQLDQEWQYLPGRSFGDPLPLI